MRTFDQLVTKVEEGWWDQSKAKLAGLGSSIAGDQAGAAKKQAQSLAKSSSAFALFDQFKQDMLELTKSTDQLQFNKNFPEQAKFIANIEANLAVLKAGNVGDPAAPEQEPDVATATQAADDYKAKRKAQINKQNQAAARAATNPADAAATAGGAAPSVQAASVHVNDVDMINEAYYSMQEAPLGKAKRAARRAKMGNLYKTLRGRGSEVVDATMAAVNSRMDTFKKKFQQTLGKLQTDLNAVGLGAESPALQAITNTLGSTEQLPPPKPEELAAATPEEEPPAEEPVPGEEPPVDPGSTTTVDVGGDDETTATFAGEPEKPAPEKPVSDKPGKADDASAAFRARFPSDDDYDNMIKNKLKSEYPARADRIARAAKPGRVRDHKKEYARRKELKGQRTAAAKKKAAPKRKAAKSGNIGWDKSKFK